VSSGGTSPDSFVRRAALATAKLDALVGTRWGARPRSPEGFALGAALVGPSGGADIAEAGEGAGTTAWLYIVDVAHRALGAALVWGERQEIDELHVLADADTGVLARRAQWFAAPRPSIWQVIGTSLVEAEPDPVPPPPHLVAPDPVPGLLDALDEAGVEVVTEAGSVRGEVQGLEVARIVHGETTAGVPLDEPLLEVGVGAADREMTATVHGALSPIDQLTRAVEIVRRHRRSDAPRHPLNQLVPERWLRAVLVRDPSLVGLASLAPAEGARPRPNLRDVDVAVAEGATPDGNPVVVVCSVGIDVELVPAAADARARLDPGAELWLVVPERDDHPITRGLSQRLEAPARVLTVPDAWRSLA
jgi:hypothetical protein